MHKWNIFSTIIFKIDNFYYNFLKIIIVKIITYTPPHITPIDLF